jgi:TRAP-type C4-dicarboxylate transport system permease large subunit
MSIPAQVFIALVGVAAALAIGLYATWLLVHRLKKGDSKPKAFGEWVRNLFEAIWGL